jgi:hypothetical protein
MLAENAAHPYLVGFEDVEVAANMCALIYFLSHCKEISECSQPNIANMDQKARERAKCYADIAATLIIRLQDALDEDQLGSLISGVV